MLRDSKCVLREGGGQKGGEDAVVLGGGGRGARVRDGKRVLTWDVKDHSHRKKGCARRLK